MKEQSPAQPAPILYIPHGGGPLPLLGDKYHQPMVDFLHSITPRLGNPSAILVISAHWERPVATITAGAKPPLFYDYYGFPDEAYQITYPAPGQPSWRKRYSRFSRRSVSLLHWMKNAASTTVFLSH